MAICAVIALFGGFILREKLILHDSIFPRVSNLRSPFFQGFWQPCAQVSVCFLGFSCTRVVPRVSTKLWTAEVKNEKQLDPMISRQVPRRIEFVSEVSQI